MENNGMEMKRYETIPNLNGGSQNKGMNISTRNLAFCDTYSVTLALEPSQITLLRRLDLRVAGIIPFFQTRVTIYLLAIYLSLPLFHFHSPSHSSKTLKPNFIHFPPTWNLNIHPSHPRSHFAPLNWNLNLFHL